MQKEESLAWATGRHIMESDEMIEQYDDENKEQPDPNDQPAVPQHCSVSGLRALVLMICRIMGLAPLTFKKQGSYWVIQVSRVAYIYSLLLISTLNIAAISSLYMDLKGDPLRAVFFDTPTEGIIWSVYYALVAVAVNISALTAPAKMRTMICFMNRIQQINSEINNNCARTERQYVAVMMVVLVLHCLLSAYDSCVLVFLEEGKITRSGIETFISCLFISHYLMNFNQLIIVLQFELNVLALQTALKTINDHLDSLFHITKEGLCYAKDDKLIKKIEAKFESTVPLKSVNIFVDRMTYNADHKCATRRSIHESIRVIALSFLDVCKLIEEVNSSFGIVVLVLILISLVQLVIMGYYSFMTLYTKPQLKMQTVWCMKHLVAMMLLVEPCHWTHQELTRTRHLMRQLTCKTATVIGPFAAVLRKFFFCLCLNKTSYSPLGMCTLTRPICVTILGSVITNLVIVMQFDPDSGDYKT